MTIKRKNYKQYLNAVKCDFIDFLDTTLDVGEYDEDFKKCIGDCIYDFSDSAVPTAVKELLDYAQDNNSLTENAETLGGNGEHSAKNCIGGKIFTEISLLLHTTFEKWEKSHKKKCETLK